MHEHSVSKLIDLFKNVLLKFLLLYLTTRYYTQVCTEVFTQVFTEVQWIFLSLTKQFAQNFKFIQVYQNFTKIFSKNFFVKVPGHQHYKQVQFIRRTIHVSRQVLLLKIYILNKKSNVVLNVHLFPLKQRIKTLTTHE